MNRQQLIWAGTAITGEDSTPCHNFGVCVEGSSILAAGSRQELCNLYPHAEAIGSERLLLVLGMVNSHDHGRAISTVAQGVPDRQLEIWLIHLAALPQIDPYLAAAYEGLRLKMGEEFCPTFSRKLLRCGTCHQVNSVMVGGHWVVKNGKSQTLERESIEQEIRGQLARHSNNQRQHSARVTNPLAPYLRSFYSQWH